MVNDLSNELRETISTLAVLQSVATNTGHLLELTGTLMSWIEAALIQKYGYELDELDPYVYELMYSEPAGTDKEGNIIPTSILDKWERAIDVYNASAHHWGIAVKICREVRTGLISIGIMEDMFDLQVMTVSFMDEMKAMRSEREDELTNDTPGKREILNNRGVR
jgi:hypothetical protein